MKKVAFENLQKHTQIIRSKIAKVFNDNRDLFIKALTILISI